MPEGKAARGRALPGPSAGTGRLQTLLLPPEASYLPAASVQCGLTFKCSRPEDASYVHIQKQFSAGGQPGAHRTTGQPSHAAHLGSLEAKLWLSSALQLDPGWIPAGLHQSDCFKAKSLYHVAELRQRAAIYSN